MIMMVIWIFFYLAFRNGGLLHVSKIYRNNGNNIFEEQTSFSFLTGVSEGSAAWGDYDNDGDLDILLMGVQVVKGIKNISQQWE